MTVAVLARRNAYTGNGATTSFPVSFPFFEIAVYLNGVVASPATYTIAQAAIGGTGTVTFLVAPATATPVVIIGKTVQSQGTDYAELDGFPADTHELALDRLTMIAQELARTLGQTVRTSESSAPVPESDFGTATNVPVVTNGVGGLQRATVADGYLQIVSGAMVSTTLQTGAAVGVQRQALGGATADLSVTDIIIPA